MQDDRDGEGGMNAVGRRKNHCAVIIRRGKSGRIGSDRQSGRHCTGDARPAGRSNAQPVSTLIGVGRNGPGDGRGIAEHRDRLRRR